MKNFEFLVDSVGENNKAIKKLQTISKAIVRRHRTDARGK